jgi:hypothetical protein
MSLAQERESDVRSYFQQSIQSKKSYIASDRLNLSSKTDVRLRFIPAAFETCVAVLPAIASCGDEAVFVSDCFLTFKQEWRWIES